MPDFVGGLDLATTLALYRTLPIVTLNAASLTLSQASVYVRAITALANQVIVPIDTSAFWAVGESVHGMQVGTGFTTLVKENAGIIFNCFATQYRTRQQGSPWSIIKVGATEYDLHGDFLL